MAAPKKGSPNFGKLPEAQAEATWDHDKVKVGKGRGWR